MGKWDHDEQEHLTREEKRGLFDKFLNVLGIEVEEVVEDDETAVAAEEPRRKEGKDRDRNDRDRAKLVNLNQSSNKSMKVIVIEPTGFDEVQGIVDHLRNKRAVIINLEETDKTIARRIADFLGGAVYAFEGSMQKISGSIFLCSPSHIEVSVPLRTELKEKERTPGGSGLSSTLFRQDRER